MSTGATCRMFQSPILESLSRIHPATPFVFWSPILGFVAYRSLARGTSAFTFALCVALGILLWTLAEYFLHRFVFHFEGDRPWQKRLHFIIHGVHHEYPNDGDRLVMPLGASVPMAILFYVLFRAVLGPVLAGPMYVGFGIGYLAYDGLHYAIHHFRMRAAPLRWLKRHHLLHHHAGERSRWGVSSPVWDIVFGTMGTARRR